MDGDDDELDFVVLGDLGGVDGQAEADEIEDAALYEGVGVLETAADAVDHELDRVADQIELVVRGWVCLKK